MLDQHLQVLLIRLVLVKERSFSIDGGTIADVVNFGTQVLQSFSLAIHLKLSDLTLLVLFIKLEQLCPLLLELGDLGSLVRINESSLMKVKSSAELCVGQVQSVYLLLSKVVVRQRVAATFL